MNNKICIVACLKHEELYVKEWLDYHIECGIDHFFLCDNNESDYEYPLIDIVQEYVDKGIVDVIDYSIYEYVQPYCYDELYNSEQMNEYGWMLVIDIDEFICLPKYDNDIKKFINEIPPHIDAISVNWKYYDDNDLVEYDGRPVLERFTRPVNVEGIYDGQSFIIKTMMRTKPYIKSNDHTIVSQHVLARWTPRYDCLFNCIQGHSRMINQNITNFNTNVPQEYLQELYKTFYIKHFHTKTIEEYIKYKVNKTVSVFIPNRNMDRIYTIGCFWTFNKRSFEKRRKIKELLGNVDV